MSYYIYIKFPLEITIINIISSFSLHNITSEKRPIPLGRFLYKKQDYEMVGSREVRCSRLLAAAARGSANTTLRYFPKRNFYLELRIEKVAKRAPLER